MRQKNEYSDYSYLIGFNLQNEGSGRCSIDSLRDLSGAARRFPLVSSCGMNKGKGGKTSAVFVVVVGDTRPTQAILLSSLWIIIVSI